MCKVMIVAGITPETNAKAIEFIKAMAEPLSIGQTDGLGYAAVKADGSLFGERWFNNKDAFKKPGAVEVDSMISALMKQYGEAIKADKETATKLDDTNYSSFGDVDLTQMTAITMHTRMATSAKGFQNTHPFYYPEADTSLIHNGIIRNVEDFEFKVSTCDSEAILISYLKHKVGHDVQNTQDMINDLTGYYACGVFSRDADGKRTMDIFKGNGASLHGRFIKELGVFVYSTVDYNIEDTCKKLGLTCGPKFTYQDEWLVRLDHLTGKVINRQGFRQGNEHLPAKVGQHWGAPHYGTNTNSSVVSKTKGTVTHLPVKSRDQVLSKDMVEYMKLKPSFEVMNVRELNELNRSLAQG